MISKVQLWVSRQWWTWQIQGSQTRCRRQILGAERLFNGSTSVRSRTVRVAGASKSSLVSSDSLAGVLGCFSRSHAHPLRLECCDPSATQRRPMSALRSRRCNRRRSKRCCRRGGRLLQGCRGRAGSSISSGSSGQREATPVQIALGRGRFYRSVGSAPTAWLLRGAKGPPL